MSLSSPLERLGRRLDLVWLERAVLVKAATFALIGVVNVAVDFSVFSIAYFRLGLPIITANVLSWCIAVTGSYVMNSLITFAKESGRRLRVKDYGSFVLSQFGGLIANTTTVFIASYAIALVLDLPRDAALPILLAKGLAIGASFLVNFSLSHFVVFRPRELP
ncbi:MAG TPA: GtrA family protein [Xanthobacteraceae bacterium]|jgi:putative flippase GtrA